LVPLTRSVTDPLYRNDPIAARIVDREPDDMMRSGFKLHGFEEFDIDAIEAELRSKEILARTVDGVRWARRTGGAGVLMVVDDGRTPDQPIDRGNIRSLRTMIALDREEVQIESWCMDPNSEHVGNPGRYRVGGTTLGQTILVHADRVLPFWGVRLSVRELRQTNGWGLSVYDRLWDALSGYADAMTNVGEMINSFSYDVLSLRGLADGVLADDPDGQEDLLARLQMLRAGLSIVNAWALDVEAGESMEPKTRSVAGINDLVQTIRSRIVEATDMPRSVLLGETPGGLNSGTNAGEIRSWYDHVEFKRERELTKPIHRALEVFFLSRLGPTNGQLPRSWGFEWLPLWQETRQEKAQTRLMNAQARALDLQWGVVSVKRAQQDQDLDEYYGPQDPEDRIGDPDPDELSEDDGIESGGAPVESGAPPEPLRSAAALGEQLGCSPQSIRGMHRRGEIRAWKIGGRYRFAPSEVFRAAGPGGGGIQAGPPVDIVSLVK
jgi:phage-related protein (TIGR01555 family)